ncbi:MAG TPA: D-2-hydroxyacid dehydrogenase [Pseudonocardiaceae bacterium]|jgi:phosphoglycerate dehydrogenase-like enzyme|nr:D-2-hydroxyacid dehydrogenase [Pseudonocardiaceae bacterium]
MSDRRVVVVIATPLEPELVAHIDAVDDRVEVIFEPDLLPPPRFACDHRGIDTFRRTEDQQRRWQAMLGSAEVLFGLPGDSAQGLADVVRTNAGLRWVQATAGGAGQQMQAAGLTDAELTRVLITSASGVHVGPLAEFALFGLLAFTKGLPRLLADTQARRWEHYPMTELADRTLLVVGLGSIGTEVARLAKAFGMHIIAINRTGRTDNSDIEVIRTSRFLGDLLPVAHAVVLTLPLTEQTRGMIDAQAISRMRTDAILINVGRGGVVDEDALIKALKGGQLAGAALDVFETEPLPPDSPLWRLPNVLISPHTAALSVHENERIVALFTENLRRYLRGDDLLNRVTPTLLY